MMAGWYTGRGGIEIDLDFRILRLDIFLGFGGIFIEETFDTSRLDRIFVGKNEEDSWGDIERDVCFVCIFFNWKESNLFIFLIFFAGLIFLQGVGLAGQEGMVRKRERVPGLSRLPHLDQA